MNNINLIKEYGISKSINSSQLLILYVNCSINLLKFKILNTVKKCFRILYLCEFFLHSALDHDRFYIHVNSNKGNYIYFRESNLNN